MGNRTASRQVNIKGTDEFIELTAAMANLRGQPVTHMMYELLQEEAVRMINIALDASREGKAIIPNPDRAVKQIMAAETGDQLMDVSTMLVKTIHKNHPGFWRAVEAQKKAICLTTDPRVGRATREHFAEGRDLAFARTIECGTCGSVGGDAINPKWVKSLKKK